MLLFLSGVRDFGPGLVFRAALVIVKECGVIDRTAASPSDVYRQKAVGYVHRSVIILLSLFYQPENYAGLKVVSRARPSPFQEVLGRDYVESKS